MEQVSGDADGDDENEPTDEGKIEPVHGDTSAQRIQQLRCHEGALPANP